jgi:hypothetical protein
MLTDSITDRKSVVLMLWELRGSAGILSAAGHARSRPRAQVSTGLKQLTPQDGSIVLDSAGRYRREQRRQRAKRTALASFCMACLPFCRLVFRCSDQHGLNKTHVLRDACPYLTRSYAGASTGLR